MIESIDYQNKHQNSGHHCHNLLIRCMDFRFHRELDQLLGELFSDEGGLGDYDSPGIAGGGAKSVIDEASRPVVFSAIDIAREKHQIKRIIIVNHVDCGAYGGSQKFDSLESEAKFHVQQLKQAAEIIKEKYPEMEVVTLYQDWETLKVIN